MLLAAFASEDIWKVLLLAILHRQCDVQVEHLIHNIYLEHSHTDSMHIVHAHACLQPVAIGHCDAQVEAKTNHDVKAIEYVIKDRISHNAELAKVGQCCSWLCTVDTYVFVNG